MSPSRSLGIIAPVLMASMGLDASMNYGSPTPRMQITRYTPQRYQNAANKKQCARRRAKNKAAKASRKRNRK